MAKTLIQPTAYNPTTREVTFPFAVDLARVYAVLNATRGAIYYSIGDDALIATAAGSVLTLNASVVTTGHLAGDKIAVIYEADELGATAALQTTGNTALASILAELNAKLEPADLAPLATDANQATQIASAGAPTDAEATGDGSQIGILKRLRTLLGSVLQVRGSRSNTGTDVAAGASHLTVGGSDGTNLRPLLTDTSGRQINVVPEIGAQADAAASSDTGTFGLFAFLKRGMQNWTTLLARTPALGQATMAASQPVAIASNQSAVPTSLATAPALVAGSALAADFGAQVRANATGAATPFNINSPATPIGQSVKVGAGRLLSLYFRNNNAASRWLKVFNATSVTMGTTAATLDIEIPPTSTGINYPIPIAGVGFATGIFIAVTGGRGLTDNTAITLNDVSGGGSFA